MPEGKIELCNVIYETGTVKDLLKPMLDEGRKQTSVSFGTLANIHMLMGVIDAKLQYYQKKYDFQVDYPGDVFYPEEIANFLMFKAKGNGQGEKGA
jgi:hypothetical protein